MHVRLLFAIWVWRGYRLAVRNIQSSLFVWPVAACHVVWFPFSAWPKLYTQEASIFVCQTTGSWRNHSLMLLFGVHSANGKIKKRGLDLPSTGNFACDGFSDDEEQKGCPVHGMWNWSFFLSVSLSLSDIRSSLSSPGVLPCSHTLLWCWEGPWILQKRVHLHCPNFIVCLAFFVFFFKSQFQESSDWFWGIV